MDLQGEMRRCLIDLDVAVGKRIWAQFFSHMGRPKDDAQMLTMLHIARTEAESVPFRHRAYSYRWLQERNLPDMLPDRLKPKADRIYPRVVEGVGIFVRSKYPLIKEAVTGAMSNAVEDCYANGDTEPNFVRSRMMEARDRELKGLGLFKRRIG